MKIDIYNLQAQKVGDLSLSEKIFNSKAPEILISRYLHVYLSNQRHAYAKTKGRGEIAGTTKKMWAQKGTGRARHSSAKAPQFVGGGVAHGPRGNQNYQLSFPKKQKKLVQSAILTKFAKAKSISVIDQFKQLPPKTKEAWKFIDLMEKQIEILSKSKKIGIITSGSLDNVKRAFRNIPGFTLLSLKSLNLYQLANQNYLLFSQKAITDLTK